MVVPAQSREDRMCYADKLAAMRGTTEQGEYRSHARMAMIEPIRWDLNEENVQPSPTGYCLFLKHGEIFAPTGSIPARIVSY